MISARFGTAVSLLLALALVPTVLHSYLGLLRDDERVAGAITSSLAGLTAERTSRSAAWVQETFHSSDWFERRYTGAAPQGVAVFVARSYDPKRLYHYPERRLFYGVEFVNLGTIRMPGRDDVPIHVRMSRDQNRVTLVGYSLLYRNEFVDNPYVSQLRAAWPLLFTGQQPMTLFLVHDAAFSPATPVDQALGLKILLEAIDSFLSQPRRLR